MNKVFAAFALLLSLTTPTLASRIAAPLINPSEQWAEKRLIAQWMTLFDTITVASAHWMQYGHERKMAARLIPHVEQIDGTIMWSTRRIKILTWPGTICPEPLVITGSAYADMRFVPYIGWPPQVTVLSTWRP